MKGSQARDKTVVHQRRGIPKLLKSGDRFDGCEATWRYVDGSQGFGSLQNFQEERDFARTMQEAKGNPLAEAYYARIGHTLAEMPIERAMERERLYRSRSFSS
jgi:hypothetical protein